MATSKKQLEKYPESIMTDDMDHCFCCSRYLTDETRQIHHVFGGPNRPLSTEFGLVIPICDRCHTGGYFGYKDAVHYNKKIMDELHECGQMVFEEHYPDQNFLKIFGKNYK